MREPYTRLQSAYIDKLYTRASWWAGAGKYILETFRSKSARGKLDYKCGSNVTFPEFVRYWIYAQEAGRHNDNHWVPMHTECRMCTFDYDLYVHLETIASDMANLYQTVGEQMSRPMSDDEWTIDNKIKDLIPQRDHGAWGDCEANCSMLGRAWWSFQARGLVGVDQDFPDVDCNIVNRTELSYLALAARRRSVGGFDKGAQRRASVAAMYRQVPLLDRLKVRDLLMPDFKLHGYDPTPRDMFPELYD